MRPDGTSGQALPWWVALARDKRLTIVFEGPPEANDCLPLLVGYSVHETSQAVTIGFYAEGPGGRPVGDSECFVTGMRRVELSRPVGGRELLVGVGRPEEKASVDAALKTFRQNSEQMHSPSFDFRPQPGGPIDVDRTCVVGATCPKP
jgi:hypothetical protein